MRTIKYHLALTDNEYSLIIKLLNDLRNDLIAQGRYNDAVDYFIPCVKTKEQKEIHLGVWSDRHRRYLK